MASATANIVVNTEVKGLSSLNKVVDALKRIDAETNNAFTKTNNIIDKAVGNFIKASDAFKKFGTGSVEANKASDAFTDSLITIGKTAVNDVRNKVLSASSSIKDMSVQVFRSASGMTTLRGFTNSLTDSLSTLTGAALVAAAGLAAVVAAVVAVVAVGAALFKAAKDAAEFGDSIYKASVQTGLSAKTLSSLNLAATETGSSLSNVTKAVSGFTDKVQQAATGLKPAQKELTALGISYKNVDTALAQAVSAVAKTEDVSKRNALAFKLFGDGAKELLPVINSFNGDLPKLTKRAEELGVTLDDKSSAASHRFTKNLAVLGLQMSRLYQTIGNELIPIFSDLTRDISSFLSRNKNEIKSWAETIASAVRTTISYITEAKARIAILQDVFNFDGQQQKNLDIIAEEQYNRTPEGQEQIKIRARNQQILDEKKLEQERNERFSTGVSKRSSVQQRSNEAEKARDASSQRERLRAIEAETESVERAYGRRKLAAVDYYDQLAELASKQIDVEIEAQQKIIASAQVSLSQARTPNDRDKAQADIINAETQIADLEAKRQSAMLSFNEKYREFQKNLSETFNQQLERVLEIAGEYDKLGEIKVANRFNKDIESAQLELDAVNKKIEDFIAVSVEPSKFMRDAQRRIKNYLDNLNFEKNVAVITERQKAIESELNRANIAANDASVTEADRSKIILEALTQSLKGLKAERVKLQGLGADTIGISATINETEQKQASETQLVFEHKINDELEKRDKILSDLAILQKSTNGDETTFAIKREAAYKATAESISTDIIPQMELYLATLAKGSPIAEAFRKSLEALKKQIATDKAPDAKALTDRALAPARGEIAHLTAERERKLTSIDQDQELSGFERAEARKRVIEETNALIQTQIDKFAALIEQQKQFSSDGTLLNADAIAQLREEWEGQTDALKQSNAEVYDYSKALKQVAKDALASGLIDFFDSLLSGTKSLKDAALDFANSFIRAIQQVIIQMLVLKTLTMLFNAISPGLGSSLFGKSTGGSIGGAKSGGSVGMYASGGELQLNPIGEVRGAGTSTSDSILSFFNSIGKFVKLSNAEYVLDGKTVSNLGTPFLDKVLESKGKLLYPLLGRANGGSVDSSIAHRASAISPRANEAALESAGGDTNVNVNLSLSPTEMMKRALQTTDGVMAIVEAIGNNSTKIKTRLEIA